MRAQELFSVCKKIEAEFVYQTLVKNLMKMAPQQETHYSFFFDMLQHHYATLIVERGGFGLANTLYQSLSRYIEEH